MEKASGTLARRPDLDKALLVAHRPGDQLVVTKLDRLGRSLEHLLELSKDFRPRVCTWSCSTRASTPRPRSSRLAGSAP